MAQLRDLCCKYSGLSTMLHKGLLELTLLLALAWWGDLVTLHHRNKEVL